MADDLDERVRLALARLEVRREGVRRLRQAQARAKWRGCLDDGTVVEREEESGLGEIGMQYYPERYVWDDVEHLLRGVLFEMEALLGQRAAAFPAYREAQKVLTRAAWGQGKGDT